jgi:dihydropyrimidine dehydrogenase (NADP+)
MQSIQHCTTSCTAHAPRRSASAGSARHGVCSAPPSRRFSSVLSAAGKNGTGRTEGLTDPAIKLVNGAVTEGPDLSVTVNGLKMPNPFVIGSGPPGTNYAVMKKAFDEGWGAVICKTLSLDSSKVGSAAPCWLASGQLAPFRACACHTPCCLCACPPCLQVINVTPRYAKLFDTNGAVFGWENMELISGGLGGVAGEGRVCVCGVGHSRLRSACCASLPKP